MDLLECPLLLARLKVAEEQARDAVHYEDIRGRRPGQAPEGAGGGAGGDQPTSGQHHCSAH